MWSISRRRRHGWLPVIGITVMLVLAGCSGPDQFGLDEPEPTVAPSPTATIEPAPEPTPSPTATPTEEPTPEPEPTPTDEPEPSPTSEPDPDPTPEPEPSPTEAAEEETPTPEPLDAMETLPRLDELSENSGYIVAGEGERTADQLAQAYMDSAAHMERLNEWGFRQHVFREFTRNESGPEDTLPTYVLATVNVYGSPEQADMALQWLERLQVSQGATVVEPPAVGQAAVAMTQQTSQGEAAAWIVYRLEERVYVYYAQGNQPLDEISAVATRVFERLSAPNDTV